MPAPVVVVHDDPETCEAILRTLSDAGLDAVGFTNPMGALDAVEKDGEARVLVSRLSFGPGKPNGLALYRVLNNKRIGSGGLRAVFIGRGDYRAEAEEDGIFLPKPFDPQMLVEAVRNSLKPDRAAPLRMATGPILWEGTSPGIVLAAPVPITDFSSRTRQLLGGAHSAIERAAAIQQWRMPTRRPFATRLG